MPKIDCSITENFLSELARATNDCAVLCSECIITKLHPEIDKGCIGIMAYNPTDTIRAIQNWSDAHPVKTRLDDLLEKYPNVPRNEDGYPTICPETLGYCRCGSLCLLHQITCDKAFKKCWDEPFCEE